MTTLQQPVQHAALQPEFESNAVARVRSLGELMARRPELSGVYTPADVSTEDPLVRLTPVTRLVRTSASVIGVNR